MQCHMAHFNTMGDSKTIEDVVITATNTDTVVQDYTEHKTAGIGAEAVVVEPTVILHITVGHTECVPIRSNIEINCT